MPGTRLYRLTTVYLAALYGVVGLTGESLHYLANDITCLWSHSKPDETVVVYYHVHGPDYHFHRHVIQRHHADATILAHDKARQGNAVIALNQTVHRPHACPLLSLVSTLKLGCGRCYTNLIDFDLLVTPSWESGAARAFQVVRYSYARGPPVDFFAKSIQSRRPMA